MSIPKPTRETQGLPEKWSPSTLREIMVGDGEGDDFLAVTVAHNRDRTAFVAEVDRLTAELAQAQAELAKYRDAQPLGKQEQIDTGPYIEPVERVKYLDFFTTPRFLMASTHDPVKKTVLLLDPGTLNLDQARRLAGHLIRWCETGKIE